MDALPAGLPALTSRGAQAHGRIGASFTGGLGELLAEAAVRQRAL